MKIFFTFLIVLFIWVNYNVFAQYNNRPLSIHHNISSTNLGISIKNLGLLDPSKLSMSQLISSNYSSSKEGNTLSAIYLNSMIYQVSPTYHWTFDLGYAGMPYNSFQNGWTGGQPIGSIGFLWTPKPNLLISAQFSKGVSYSQEFLYTPYKRSIIQNP